MTDEPMPAPVAAPASPPAKRRGGIGCLVVIGLFAAVIAVFVTIGATAGPNLEISAQIACENLVSDQLKSPATAEYNDKAVGKGSRWTVTGTVDAQNGFGAMLRSSFQCVVKIDETKETTSTKLKYFHAG